MNNTILPAAPRPVRTFKTPPDGGSLYDQNPGFVAVIVALLASVFLWLVVQLIEPRAPEATTPGPIVSASSIVAPTPTLTVLCVFTNGNWVVSAYDEYGFGAVVTNPSLVAGLNECLDYMD